MDDDLRKKLLDEIQKLHERKELSKTVDSVYFEPGVMEYLEQSEGLFDDSCGEILIRFEAKGTRYDGRTEQIEKVKQGDSIQVIRDRENPVNSNNFTLLTRRNQNVGNMPAELCNAIAPLVDEGKLIFNEAFVSYVEPISKRSRYAKQAMLFVELKARFLSD